MLKLLLGLITALLLLVSPQSPIDSATASSDYTLTKEAAGVDFSARFERRDFPAKALVPITVTVRNILNRSLQVIDVRRGICGAPLAYVVSVDAKGHDITPKPKIPPPSSTAPKPVSRKFPLATRARSISWHPSGLTA